MLTSCTHDIVSSFTYFPLLPSLSPPSLSLSLPPPSLSLSLSDQTPTPTRFLRNCEEAGLFQELEANPFEHVRPQVMLLLVLLNLMNAMTNIQCYW